METRECCNPRRALVPCQSRALAPIPSGYCICCEAGSRADGPRRPSKGARFNPCGVCSLATPVGEHPARVIKTGDRIRHTFVNAGLDPDPSLHAGCALIKPLPEGQEHPRLLCGLHAHALTRKSIRPPPLAEDTRRRIKLQESVCKKKAS